MQYRVPDLSTTFLGIKSPTPFWLASAPPTDKEYNVRRAFEAGWGGVVWKTLGSEGPPIVNVNGPRYGAIWGADRRLLGLNNIELITDRPIEDNLKEIAEVKRHYPKHALIVSLMVESKREAWHAMVKRTQDTGADGIELNFGCPHGMSERGMGSSVGQVPEYIEMVARWCKTYTRLPVIVNVLAGTLHPDEVKDACGLVMPDGEYETIAGFVLAELSAGGPSRATRFTLAKKVFWLFPLTAAAQVSQA